MDEMSACDGDCPTYPEINGEACQTVSQMQYRYVVHGSKNLSVGFCFFFSANFMLASSLSS
jgi:hypothetical protein